MTPSLGARIGAALTAALLALALCELAARAVFPPPPDSSREPQVGYIHDSALGHVPVPDQRAWVDDGLVTINSMGFRGREFETPKPDNRYRVLAVGDSLTFGWGVNDDETFPAKLETLLRARMPARDLEVVNAAVPAYNATQSVARLARSLPFVQPDLVVLGLYSNDIPGELASVGESPEVPRSPDQSQPGRVMHFNTPPGPWWMRLLRQSRAAHVAGRAAKRMTGHGEWAMSHFALEMDLLNGRTSPELEEAWSKVRQQLVALSELSHENGFSVAIVVLPCKEQVVGQFTNAQFQSRVRDIAEPLGFLVIDPLPMLARAAMTRGDLFIPYDRNHPSAPGHEIVANAIADGLPDRLLTSD